MTVSDTFLSQTVAQLEQVGFLPYDQIRLGKRLAPGLTLHEAIRFALGMKENDSIYMYWEWQYLKPSIDQMWNALDDAATSVGGRRTSAIAFCSTASRSLDDVLEMFKQVDKNLVLNFPSATRRPTRSEAQVRFVGKLLGAILMALGSLEASRDSGFGDLFSTIAEEGMTNIELLSRLDEIARSEIVDLELAKPPRSIAILRALGWALEHMNETRMTEGLTPLTLPSFFVETELSANWSGMSDKMILRRLLAMAPEDTAESAKKAIEKFLAD